MDNTDITPCNVKLVKEKKIRANKRQSDFPNFTEMNVFCIWQIYLAKRNFFSSLNSNIKDLEKYIFYFKK